MDYIENWFHFYDTEESFELHKKHGLINPDSICFIRDLSQISTQNHLFGISRKEFRELEQLVKKHDIQIKEIPGVEAEPGVGDGVINSITDIINFLSGYTDKDNLKKLLEVMETTLSKALKDGLDGKVDKVSGKGLSSNDFTDDYRSKLDGLNPIEDKELNNILT